MEQTSSKTSELLWTKQYILTLIVTTCMCVVLQMTMSAIPLYAGYLGGSSSLSGMMVGGFTFAALLLRPVSGTLLDNFGRRIILLSGSLLIIPACFSYPFIISLPLLLIFRILQGFGFSAQSTAIGAIVSDLVPASRRAEGIGYFGVANSIGLAAGPALGLSIIERAGYTLLFYVAGAAAIVCFAGGLLLKYKGLGRAKAGSHGKEKDIYGTLGAGSGKTGRFVLFEKTAVPAGIILFLCAFTYGAVITFLPAYGKALGIENVGLFFAVCAFSQLGIRIVSGRLTDRYGAWKVLIPVIPLLALTFLLLSFSSSLRDFIIVGILYGISYGTAQPTLNAVMFSVCPCERRGSASAAYYTCMDAGVGLGAILWGIISPGIGLSGIYLASAGCILIAFLAHLFILRKQLKNWACGVVQ